MTDVPRPRSAHRRSISDPTDWLAPLRDQLAAERAADSSSPPASSADSSSDASPRCAEASPSTRIPPPRGAAAPQLVSLGPLSLSEEDGIYTATAPNFSKKDVPMWTVEEDILILKLVEKHGKRWSKIASHLPGRTDNGVRNRWNRMERAQVLKLRRAPGAGYRCRRCGEPKRGHICAARSLLGDASAPEGEELTSKAAALTEYSAAAIKAHAAHATATAGAGAAGALAPLSAVPTRLAAAPALLAAPSPTASAHDRPLPPPAPYASPALPLTPAATPAAGPVLHVPVFAAASCASASASAAAAPAVAVCAAASAVRAPGGRPLPVACAAHMTSAGSSSAPLATALALPSAAAPVPVPVAAAAASASAASAPLRPPGVSVGGGLAQKEREEREAMLATPVDDFLMDLCASLDQDGLLAPASACSPSAPPPALQLPPAERWSGASGVPPLLSQASLQEALASIVADPELLGSADGAGLLLGSLGSPARVPVFC